MNFVDSIIDLLFSKVFFCILLYWFIFLMYVVNIKASRNVTCELNQSYQMSTKTYCTSHRVKIRAPSHISKLSQLRPSYFVLHWGHFYIIQDIFIFNFISPNMSKHSFQHLLFHNFHFHVVCSTLLHTTLSV